MAKGMHPVIQTLIDSETGSNTICQECRRIEAHLTHALGPWFVCDPSNGTDSVLFVGKVARGDYLGEEIAPSFEDVQNFGRDFIKTSSWPYWSYTREILIEVFGDLERGLQCSSFTNIVKCNNESTPDTTNQSVKDHCIQKNGFIWKEFEAIKPRVAVFYTHTAYDSYIDSFRPADAIRWEDNRSEWVEVGKKRMPWWDRSFFTADNRELLRFLRVGHPERKRKDEFVKMISKWIIDATKSGKPNKMPPEKQAV
jgi:hypothetical protein